MGYEDYLRKSLIFAKPDACKIKVLMKYLGLENTNDMEENCKLIYGLITRNQFERIKEIDMDFYNELDSIFYYLRIKRKE